MRSACARSPAAGRPPAPSGFGRVQVPGGVDHGVGEVAALHAVLVDDQLERRVVAAGVLELVDPGARDADHARAEMQRAGDLRRRGQRLQVALDDLGAGRIARRPSGAVQPWRSSSSTADRVEVELPRREHAHVPPLADAGADRVAGLEHERLQAAGEQVRRGGQADRAGADHRDAVGVRVVHGQRSSDGIEKFRCDGGTVAEISRGIKFFRYAARP